MTQMGHAESEGVRRLTRRGLLWSAAAAAAFGAASAGKGRPSADAAGGPTTSRLIVAADFDLLSSTDPGRSYEGPAYPVYRATYDTLVTVPPDAPGKIVPALATHWTVSPDATVLTFRLRRGVRFATGNVLTGADVRWSFERLKNLEAPPSWLADSIRAIETPDPTTVRIVLQRPDSSFLAALTSTNFSVLDSKYLATWGGTDAPGAAKSDRAGVWLDTHSAGSGPYLETAWVRKTQITLRRFRTSWRPAVFEEVLFKEVPNAEVARLMLERGDADVAPTLVAEQLAALAGNPKVRIASALALGFVLLGMTRSRTLHDALPEPGVGNAIRHAIDYAGIRALLPGAVTPPSVVPIGLAGALGPEDAVKTDVQRAKALLTAAGFASGFGATLTFPAQFVYFGIQFGTLAAKLQADLAAVGIRLTLEPLEQRVFSQKYRSGRTQMVLAAWTDDYPDAGDFVPAFAPGGLVAKRMHWDTPNSRPATLSAHALATGDAALRARLYQEAQRALLADGPWAIIIQPLQQIAYRAALTGVDSNPVWWYDVARIRPA
jgi:peptide/nickel transport system substrate-binding protein